MKNLRNLEVRNYGGVVSSTTVAVDLGLGRPQELCILLWYMGGRTP